MKSKITIKKEIDILIAYILVGVPGAGKSTWAKNQTWTKDCIEISTDFHVEQYAKEKGKTYSEVFDAYMSTAIELMISDVHNAIESQKCIIWDQTSTSVKTRARKIRMLNGYHKIAVVFRTPPMEELMIRLDSRPGKNIPTKVLFDMIDRWEEPTEAEGFDEIWYAS